MSQTMAGGHRRAATLVDVLVAGGAVLVLALIVGAGFESEWRERQKTGRCLGNLQQIGRVLQQYAAEDSSEQAIPLHPYWFSVSQPGPFTLHVAPWVWGGVSGTRPWRVADSPTFVLTEGDPLGDRFSGSTRPLRRYNPTGRVGAGPVFADVFACPADSGFPQDDVAGAVFFDDLPVDAREVPLIEALGNSYRHEMRGFVRSGSRTFSAAPFGHRFSTLVRPDRQALVFDSLFREFRGISGHAKPRLIGWHGELRADNVLYADGGARFTYADPYQNGPFPDEPPIETIDPNYRYLLTRGEYYKLDCYPTPGAALSRLDNFAWVGTLGNPNLWPFANHQRLVGGQ